MRYLFKRDTLLVTVSVFIILGLFLAIPFNFHFLQPVESVLYDFDYNDLAYSQLHKSNAAFDERIVIVNIGDTDRAGIAAILQKLNTAKPSVIGADILFESVKDPKQDATLVAVIKSIPNLVLCNKINDTGTSGIFNQYATKSGYANFYGEKGNVIRYFAPIKNINGTQHKSFAAAITFIADSSAYLRLRRRDKHVEVINYRREASKYLVVDYHDLLANKVAPESLKDKIVLVGYLSSNPDNIEDKHFTPMNPVFMGKSLPDNFGVIIHANIISMVLDNDYIFCLPWWFNWVLAVVLGWLYIAVFSHYFIDKHIWFHVVVSTIELVSLFVFIFVGLLLFNSFNIKIDLTETFGVIIISSQLLYFYQGLAVWLHRRFKIKSIFYTPNH
jgi:CHASE2 domain-containing sensor protein